jgi:hypothetical protein
VALAEQQALGSACDRLVAAVHVMDSTLTKTINSRGGVMPRSRAQASRSAGVWQQQLVQHWWAFWHPQGLSIHGKATDESFAPIVGILSGTPPATTRYISADSHPTIGKPHFRNGRRKGRNMTRLAVR